VFLVVYATLTEVWRKTLLTNLVSGPMCVNRAHFWLVFGDVVLVMDKGEELVINILRTKWSIIYYTTTDATSLLPTLNTWTPTSHESTENICSLLVTHLADHSTTALALFAAQENV
jgi:hypothetical protein